MLSRGGYPVRVLQEVRTDDMSEVIQEVGGQPACGATLQTRHRRGARVQQTARAQAGHVSTDLFLNRRCGVEESGIDAKHRGHS